MKQLGQIDFSSWELIFAIFRKLRKYPVPSTQYPEVIIFSFFLSTCNRNTYFQTININQYFVVSERKMQVVIEQTRFPSTVFLRSEFKLENIYSGVNFCGKNVCGNFYLRELIFADRWKNRKNRKN